MWDWLPSDVQLLVAWKMLSRLIKHNGNVMSAWREAENVELINRFFHKKFRHVALLLASEKYMYKDQRVSDIFCRSMLLVAKCCLDDLQGAQQNAQLLDFSCSMYTSVYKRFSSTDFKWDSPVDELFASHGRLNACNKHIEGSLSTVIPDKLRSLRDQNEQQFKKLGSFVMKAFSHVDRLWRERNLVSMWSSVVEPRLSKQD